MNEWRMMSMGEVADKMIILQVKCLKFRGTDKYKMVRAQCDFIMEGFYTQGCSTLTIEQSSKLKNIIDELYKNNLIQWNAEDAVLASIDVKAGIYAAKTSRKYNILRAELKKQIDIIFDERFLEVKDYASGEELE